MPEHPRKEAQRPAYPSPGRQWFGIVLSVATIGAYHLVVTNLPGVKGMGAAFLLLILFVTYWSGIRAGVVGALLILAYIPVAATVPAHPMHGREDIARLVGVNAVSLTILLVLVGVPSALVRRAGQRAYDAGQAALEEAEHRRAAEARLTRSEALHSTVVDSAMDAVIAMDRDGIVSLWNKSAEGIFGWSSEEAVGMRLSDLIVPPSQRDAHEAGLERFRMTCEGQILGRRMEMTARHKSGTSMDVELSVVAHGSGPETLFVGFVRDVTAQKRTQRELQLAQRMESVGKLAGGIAHDFNNVLSVVIGCTELARRKLPPDHPAQSDLDEVSLAARRSSEINSQLLSVARRQVTSPKTLSLNAIVEGLKPMFAALVPEDIVMSYSLSDRLWPVEVDQGQIEQVVTNLVINARDAMPEGGRLVIETRNATIGDDPISGSRRLPVGEYALLSVTDSGSGIPYGIQDRIFEPFFTTKGEKGTGLGLASAYGIVKQSGGLLTVYSEPEQGAAFCVYLPRTKGTAEAPGAATTVVSASRGDETVLLAEDNEQVRSMLVKTLEHYGYSVIAAESGQHALDLAAEHGDGVSLLITDLVMPGMSGSDLAREARRLLGDMPVLFLSGYSEEVVTSKGVHGVDGWFLQKPVMPIELAAKVREILDGVRAN